MHCNGYTSQSNILSGSLKCVACLPAALEWKYPWSKAVISNSVLSKSSFDCDNAFEKKVQCIGEVV